MENNKDAMQFLTKSSKHRHLSDALSWAGFINPEIIWTKQAEFMSVLLYRPHDIASASAEQLQASRAALNSAIAMFGNRWALWFECQRNYSHEYPRSEWPDAVSRLIDEQRRILFQEKSKQLVSDYFITLLYAPPDDSLGRIGAHFDEGTTSDDLRFRRELETFQNTVSAFMCRVLPVMPWIYRLSGRDLLTYLHSTISTRRHSVRVPDVPLYISEALTDDDYVGGYSPMLGDQHMRTLRVTSYPDSTLPAVFDALNDIEFPYRNVSRWLPYSRDDAERELEYRKSMWANRRLAFVTQLMKRFTRTPIDESDVRSSAETRMHDVEGALNLLSSGDATFGLWSHTVTVQHEDQDLVEQQAREIQKVFGAAGFTSAIARYDSTSAWIGSLPGHPHGDLGRMMAHSVTFADVLPCSAVWDGPDRDMHLDGPPLLRCISDGGTPFRFSLHQPGSDVGHMLVIGQTGAGKSTLLGSMIAAHRRYSGSQVIVIDRGGSAKVITRALGGSWCALAAGDTTVSLQPLALMDGAESFAWAYDFVLGIVEQQGVECTPQQKHELSIALQALASRPSNRRTLSMLRMLVQDQTIKFALTPFCKGGAHGDLLDNDSRVVSDADVVCFETESLKDESQAIGPVLATVFHEIERRFDGRPTLLVIDEAWSLLDNPMMAARLRSWLKTARKANVAVVMATQSISDITGSGIREILSESCPTRVFTANTRALEPMIAETYAKLGLTKEQVQIVGRLRPKDEYAFSAPGCWRKFSLALSDNELEFVGRNRPEDRRDADRISRDYPQSEFGQRWLERNLKWIEAAE